MKLLFLLGCVCLAVASACGGKAISSDDTIDGDSGSFGRHPDGSTDGNNGFIDPRCPDAGPPQTVTECSIFKQDCPDPGEGCYPSSIPPTEPCQSEVYGSFCLSVGTGTQGAPCDNGAGCAPGFVCLITGATTQCAKLCDFAAGANSCTDGFVCEPIDVPGFSACL